MRKFFALLAVPLALLSCSKQYIIQGSSTVQSLDGKMLYLKALKDNQLVDIDSCEVIHGQFEFSGVWELHHDGQSLYGRREHYASGA